MDLKIEIDEEIPMVIFTEATKLKQILLNITSNALKYTFDGYIKLSASLVRGSNPLQKRFIRIDVEDTGIGIKQQDLKELQVLLRQKD